MAIHENIRAIREARGLTQVAVAEAIGSTKSTLSKIERGARNVTVDELRALAEAFAIPMEAVVDYDPARAPGSPSPPPEAVTIADQRAAEQLRLLQELDDDDRATVFKIVDQMLTNKRFRDFFRENVAA